MPTEREWLEGLLPESREDDVLEHELMLASIDEGDPTDWSPEQQEIVRLQFKVDGAKRAFRDILSVKGENFSRAIAETALARLHGLG